MTVGLDIGTAAVRAVQLKVSRGGATVQRIGQVELPPGAVRDGEIAQPDVVTAALTSLWQTHKLGTKKVALAVSNQQVVVRQLDLPYLPADELIQSIPFSAQDHVPFPLDTALYDVAILDSYETDDGERYSRVLLVAARAPMVEGLLNAVRAAKLTPVGIDLAAFSVLRTFVPTEEVAPAGGQLLIDIGSSVTDIVVHAGGEPRFVRILPMGGDDITDGLVGQLGLSRDEAEQAKRRIGLVPPGSPADDPDAARVILERTNRFVQEVRGSLDYYSALAESVPVDGVVLTGGGSLLTNLPERLADALRLEVRRGAPLAELSIGSTGYDGDQLTDAAPFLALACGLALGAAE